MEANVLERLMGFYVAAPSATKEIPVVVGTLIMIILCLMLGLFKSILSSEDNVDVIG